MRIKKAPKKPKEGKVKIFFYGPLEIDVHGTTIKGIREWAKKMYHELQDWSGTEMDNGPVRNIDYSGTIKILSKLSKGQYFDRNYIARSILNDDNSTIKNADDLADNMRMVFFREWNDSSLDFFIELREPKVLYNAKMDEYRLKLKEYDDWYKENKEEIEKELESRRNNELEQTRKRAEKLKKMLEKEEKALERLSSKKLKKMLEKEEKALERLSSKK